MWNEGRLIVISGPSGVGKTSLCERLLEYPGFERVVTCTTRPPREAEVNGQHYNFLSRDEFETAVRQGKFLEHAIVHGHLYGTPKAPVEDGIRRGRLVILGIDVQGAAQIQEAVRAGSGGSLLKGRLTTVFILPPDLDELEKRLSHRGSEDREQVRSRLEAARRELLEKDRYDHWVINADLAQAVRDVLSCVGYGVDG